MTTVSLSTCQINWQDQFEQKKVFGTWDFKWPQNYTIRLAFQEPPDALARDVWRDVLDQIEACATDWNTVGARIKLEPLTATLPRPTNATDFGKSDLSQEHREVKYDVLISIAPLPISGMVHNPQKDEPEKHVIAFPTAHLGRFAVRADYGVPTVHLGQPQVWDKLSEILRDSGDYFKSRWFKTAVFHELGHVLGLPHPHQSPFSQISLKSAEEILRCLEHKWPVDRNHVDTQVLFRWPSTRSSSGGALFSDWPVPSDLPVPRITTTSDLPESVMNFPFLKFLLAGSQNTAPELHDGPTRFDKMFLKKLYGSRH